MAKSYIDKMMESKVKLERYKTALIKDYDSVYVDLTKSINDLLGLSDLSVKNTKKVNTLLKKLKKEQEEIISKGLVKLNKQMEVIPSFEEDLSDFGLNKVPSKKESLDLSYSSPIQANGKLIEEYYTDYTKKYIDAVVGKTRLGVANGLTNHQIIQSIIGTKKNDYKDGVISMSRRDAEGMIRTTASHISSETRKATYESNGIAEYQIVSTLDSRTSEICRSLDLKVFKVGKGPMPPFHIRCRTTTVPYFGESIWDKGATRSSEDGPVPANMSYYDWLKSKDKSYQDDVLGKKNGELFRSDTMTLDKFTKLNLHKVFTPIPIEDIIEVKPQPKVKEVLNGNDPEVKEVFKQWSGQHKHIRSWFYGDSVSDVQRERAETISRIFDKYDPDYKGTLYRGLDLSNNQSLYEDIKSGNLVFSDLAPSSYTRSMEVAKEFTYLDTSKLPVLIKYSNASGYDISPFSVFKDEDEILIPPNRELKIVKTHTKLMSGKRVLIVEVSDEQ